MRLLLAEDEKELSKALCAILKHNNYSVDAVYDGQDALDYGLDENYDGIILDLMMPKKNGLEVLEELRKAGVSTPVLILTAKTQLEDKIAGLDKGADDYLTKPFATGELLARIRAMTRRKSEFTPNLMTFGNLSLNRETFELSSPTGTVRLGNKEFQMLELLMDNPGRLISTEQFMERIWGYEYQGDTRTVDVHIRRLREKLELDPAHPDYIATKWGVGYYFSEK